MTRIAFDLDGTLVDSAPDILAAANRFLDELGREPLPAATLRSFIGNGIPKLTERVARARNLDPQDHATHTARLLEIYNAAPTATSNLYPNVTETLARLSDMGHRLSVCTNKPEATTLAMLDAFDIARFFEAVIGGDTLPTHKPDPAPLLAALSGDDIQDGLLVGDSEVDGQTAANAGVPFFLFTEGYHRGPLSEIPSAALFSDFAQLPSMIAKRSALF